MLAYDTRPGETTHADPCQVDKSCPNEGTNERLLVMWTPGSGFDRKEFVYRQPVCNDHLAAAPYGMKFEGTIELGDDAVSVK